MPCKVIFTAGAKGGSGQSKDLTVVWENERSTASFWTFERPQHFWESRKKL